MIHISMHAIERQKQPRIHVLGLHYNCQVDFHEEKGRFSQNPRCRAAISLHMLLIPVLGQHYHCQVDFQQYRGQHRIPILGLHYHCQVDFQQQGGRYSL